MFSYRGLCLFLTAKPLLSVHGLLLDGLSMDRLLAIRYFITRYLTEVVTTMITLGRTSGGLSCTSRLAYTTRNKRRIRKLAC